MPLNTHIHLVPRLKKSTVIHLLPLCASTAGYGVHVASTFTDSPQEEPNLTPDKNMYDFVMHKTALIEISSRFSRLLLYFFVLCIPHIISLTFHTTSVNKLQNHPRNSQSAYILARCRYSINKSLKLQSAPKYLCTKIITV